MNSDKIPRTIDEYIEAFPENVQEKLMELRETIKKTAPAASEKISYRMPSYTYKGMLLYFGAHKNHIGFYPFTTAIEAFRQELSEYNCSKGTVQFPIDKPLPLEIIKRMVDFRVKENLHKAEVKTMLKKARKPSSF
jgi:uncharacterized protein YdhG (YjbR/CyaY superfamily)